MYLYKRSHPGYDTTVSGLSDMGLVWFSPESNYGSDDTYGPIMCTYIQSRNLNLLNLGSIDIRYKIERDLIKKHKNLTEFIRYHMDPDVQYSGGITNKILHEFLFENYSPEYDGTIIVDSEVDSEELEGPTEVVLWGDLTDKIIKL